MQRPQGLSSSDPQQWLRQRVLSHDGQGGALLREFAKLDKFGSDTIATLDAACGDVQQVRAAMVAALVTGTRGEVATLVRPRRRPWKRSPLLARSHTRADPDQL